jgi:hypothetical protein
MVMVVVVVVVAIHPARLSSSLIRNATQRKLKKHHFLLR